MNARNEFFPGQRTFASVEGALIPEGKSPSAPFLRAESRRRYANFSVKLQIAIRVNELFAGNFADGCLTHKLNLTVTK